MWVARHGLARLRPFSQAAAEYSHTLEQRLPSALSGERRGLIEV